MLCTWGELLNRVGKVDEIGKPKSAMCPTSPAAIQTCPQRSLPDQQYQWLISSGSIHAFADPIVRLREWHWIDHTSVQAWL